MAAEISPPGIMLSERIEQLTSLLNRQNKAIDQLLEHRRQLKKELLVMKERKLSGIRQKPVAASV
ncbi:MAG: hypothetical protein NXI22_15905 [bacterium]|nr:hypothetical protein [bacterium]